MPLPHPRPPAREGPSACSLSSGHADADRAISMSARARSRMGSCSGVGYQMDRNNNQGCRLRLSPAVSKTGSRAPETPA